MEKAKINASELAALMLLFEIGSAVVVGLGMQAKQDAWMAILIGMAVGFILFLIYDYLYRHHSSLSLIGYLQIILGKWVGRAVAFLYIVYFFYIASRVLRDFGAMLLSSTLPLTPMLVVNMIMMLAAVYACTLGIETIGRASEIFLSIVCMLAVLAIFLLTASNVIDWEHLKPSLEHGWKPVLQTVFPQTMTFPFGEIVAFSMLLPYLNNPLHARRLGLVVILISGIVLSFIIAVNISVLTAYNAENATFPLLRTIGKIRLAGFIERLEAIAIVTLIIGGFFKITIFYYAAVKGTLELFQVGTRKELALWLGLPLLVSSEIIADNYTEHIHIGLKLVPLYLHLPFQAGIPLLLLIITWVRKGYHPTSR